jgi:hypothetical protein
MRQRTAERLGAFRYSAVELLITLVLLLGVMPFVERLPHGMLVEVILFTVVMASAVLAVGGRRRTLAIALLLVAPAVGVRWVNHVVPGTLFAVIGPAAAAVFLAFVVAHLLHFILRAQRVDANVLCAGISGYLMLGLLWAPLYVLVARLSPGAFVINAGPGASGSLENFESLYFSFITLCTVGYGDIVPVAKEARMLAMLEAVTGLFYMAVLISRLVAVYSAQPAAADTRAQ